MSSGFLKIFFVTDVHGSTTCFRKFLNAADRPSPPDILILGGDITGKYVIPFVQQAHGKVLVDLPGRKTELASEDVPGSERELVRGGCYIYKCEPSAYKAFCYDDAGRRNIAKALQIQRIKEWIALAEEKLDGKATRLIINTGNDDDFYIDKELQSSRRIEFPDNRILSLPQGLLLLSIGHSNPTPWNCPRELPEEKLRNRIAKLVTRARDYEKCIFNFHCPPKNTQLDLAPRLDKTLRPQLGLHGGEFVHVGSTAVREAIETFQPQISIHGHVHEHPIIEKIGKTTCANPGSSYSTGSLQGLMLTFREGVLTGARLTQELTTPQGDRLGKIIAAGFLAAVPGAGVAAAMHQQEELEDSKKEIEDLKRDVKRLEGEASK